MRLLTHLISRLARLVAAIPVPRFCRAPLWKAIARILGADPAEAALPLSAFSSFQAFFTRALAPGLRPLAGDASTWISPVDASWLAHEHTRDDSFIPVKNNRHLLSEFLQQPVDDWDEATVSTFYLRPKDYHRVHAPTNFNVTRIRHVPGLLLPVNRWGQKVPGLFGINERMILQGEQDGMHVYVVFVGALMVGSIALSHPELNALEQGHTAHATIARGDELGMFRFGSTVILVTNRHLGSPHQEPQEIRMGHALFPA